MYWAMFIVANILKLMTEPFIWADIVNTVQREGVSKGNISHLIGLLVLIVIIEFLFWSLHGPARVLERSTAFKVRINYRRYMLGGIMNLPMPWHVDHHSGDTIDKVEKGSTALYNFAEDSFEVIYSVVQLLTCYLMLAYVSPWASLIVLVTLSLSVMVTMYFDKQLVPQYQTLSRSENKVSRHVFDAISNISTVIILRAERLIFRSIMQQVEEPYELDKKTNRISETKWFINSVICKFTTACVLSAYFVGQLRTNDAVMAGTIVLLMTYLRRVEDVYFRFTGMYSDIVKRRARLANAEEVASDFTGVTVDNHVLPINWKEINVQGLHFRYNADTKHPLRDISLRIKRGERIAVVGRSGSGKSSMFRVINSLYIPQSLTLTVDGKKIPQGFSGISSATTLVPQDPEIFNETIEHNITLGEEYPQDRIERCVDVTCFTDVVASLPKGYQSSVNEKGVDLSGGEKQRLALARALIVAMDKDIVLLDEPTSSLDAATQERVHAGIGRLFNGKTIIWSIHGLHSLHHFDRVIVFHEGEIVGDGTPDEVRKNCTHFQELWRTYQSP
jgi:ABC-type multidrug transport system fused ATPase/permease subunit